MLKTSVMIKQYWIYSDKSEGNETKRVMNSTAGDIILTCNTGLEDKFYLSTNQSTVFHVSKVLRI